MKPVVPEKRNNVTGELCNLAHSGRSPLMVLDMLVSDLVAGMEVEQQDYVLGKQAIEKLRTILDALAKLAQQLDEEPKSKS